MSVEDLHAEYRRDGAPWVAVAAPRLSWRTVTDVPGWRQTAARIRATFPDRDGETTGARLDTADSVLVDWPCAPLRSRERVEVAVTVEGTDGSESTSAPLYLEAPLFDPAEWAAAMITFPDGTPADKPGQLRHGFTVGHSIVRGRLYVTALGSYEIEINGRRVGDEVLAPGWTVYQDRLLYQVHDVTGFVQPGANAIGAWLAGAWYTEKYGFLGRMERFYPGPPGLLAQLELTYTDGTRTTVATSQEWLSRADGPLISSGIYRGESFDARRHDPAWSRASADPGGWRPARIIPFDRRLLAPTAAEPVCRTQEVAPVATFASPSGKTIVDFGQNLVGRIRLRLRGTSGQRITLRHAEVLEAGELAIRPLRTAAATDEYVAAGSGEEVWEPRFTFHGFRYLQADGWTGTPEPGALTAVVCHNDMRRTGWFESSSALVNRLHENAVWSTRGNFLSIPTDCPQRDERLGWTGDFQAFAPAAAALYDMRGFAASWLVDLALEQARHDGIAPIIVPNVSHDEVRPVAAWGDATTVVPWVLYERFGDIGILRRQYDSMTAWVEAVQRVADPGGLWTRGFQIGDHLDPSGADRPGGASTDPAIVASAYLYRSLDLVARSAALLGRADDAARYRDLAEKTRRAFVDTFVTPGGRMMSDAQTAYALALVFDLVQDADHRQRVGDRLAERVRENGYRIATGFVGTPLVMDALTASGHLDAAARLLLQTEPPSWLYAVTHGATTIWERWDSMLPDGSVHPSEMTSFNHYALGAVVDWLHRCLGGLAPAEPGYRSIRIAPAVLPGFDSAQVHHDTPYGPAEVAWRIAGERLTLRVVVPPGATARVRIPGGTGEVTVESGQHSWNMSWMRREATHPVHGLRSDLADLIDDREAYLAVLEELRTHDPHRAEAFATGTRWATGMPLSGALMFAEPAALDAIERRLGELNEARRSAL